MSKKQGTLGGEIRVQCKEVYGGNPVFVTIQPAKPNTGIIFTDGKERVPLKNEYISPSWKGSLVKTIVLRSPETKLKIRILEHITGNFFAYGIDNAVVKLEMDPKLTHKIFSPFGIALRNNLVVPYFPDLQRGLCSRLDRVGVVKKGEKKYLRLRDEGIDTGKLKLEKIAGDDFQIRLMTEYRVASGEVVKDDVTVTITPEEYRGIAHARAFFSAPSPKFAPEGFTRKTGILYSFPILLSKASSSFSKSVMRAIGPFLYLGYGLGHGIDETNAFYPPDSEKEWRNREQMKGEVALHGVLDKTGDLAKRLDLAFGARPAGMKLTCKFAGHRDSHNFVRDCLTRYKDKFYTE